MSYRQFVKENFHSLGDMPAKEKMKKLGEMWRKHTGKAPMAKKAKGKGLIGDLFPPAKLLGMGMEQKQRRRRGKGVVGGDAEGSGVISSVLDSIGLGVQKRGRKMKGKGVVGGDIAGDLMKFIGMGVKPKKGKGVVGGGVAGGDVAGGGIFSGLLSAVGLGMPEHIKRKHFNRMMALEQKLHKDGKLTPANHQKLKVYHHLHGAGFFDSLFKGAKKAVGAVADNIGLIKKVVPEVAKFIPQGVKDKAMGMLPGVAKQALPLLAKVL